MSLSNPIVRLIPNNGEEHPDFFTIKSWLISIEGRKIRYLKSENTEVNSPGTGHREQCFAPAANLEQGNIENPNLQINQEKTKIILTFLFDGEHQIITSSVIDFFSKTNKLEIESSSIAIKENWIIELVIEEH